MDILALLFSLGSALGFALYVVPRKLSKEDNITFTFWMSVTFTLMSLILYLINGLNESSSILNLVLSSLTGLIWTFAFICYIKSIQMIGLIRANLWKNADNVLGVILPLIFLQEYLAVNVFVVIASTICITLGAFIFSMDKVEELSKKQKIMGIVLALAAATIFGTNALLSKMISTDGVIYTQLIIKSITVLISMIIVMKLSKKSFTFNFNVNKHSLLSGIIYSFGNLCLFLGFSRALGTEVWLVNQCDAIVIFVLGLFVFKEIDYKKHWLIYTVAIVLTFLGVYLIA